MLRKLNLVEVSTKPPEILNQMLHEVMDVDFTTPFNNLDYYPKRGA